MKSIKLLFISILFSSVASWAQLSAGDIAFIGFNTDADEGFSFITLTDIPGSEEIYFTDYGVVNATAWNVSAECYILFTAPPAGISCGTIVSITEGAADVLTITGAPGASFALTGSFIFGSGDQILAFQTDEAGFPATPSLATFIAGIHTDYDLVCIDPVTFWTQESCVSSTSESTLPPGLTNGVNCLSQTPAGPEADNGKYNGTLTGTSTALRTAINDYTNWVTSDAGAYAINPADYPSPSVTCVAPCSNPTVPVITYSPAVICEGESTTLTISGTLNDATAWHIYTGSCGGTEIGTTAGTTFDVTPAGPSTTYFVRGEGGCVSPGACGTVTVTITATDDATFSYDETSYCPNGSDPTPTATLGGGTFSAEAGLVIDSGTGTIDLSASTDGTYTITYTTSGDCPNSSEFVLTIEDSEAPVPDLVTLPTLTAECEITTLVDPDVTDNCTDPVIITHDATLPITEQGTFTITWTYDDGNGNTSAQTQTVVIDDITAPIPTAATLDIITAECEVTTLVSPSATDNCAGTVTVTNDVELPINTQGTTIVTWTYTDVNGNSSTQTQEIVIDDITAPVPTEDPLADYTTACELTELVEPTATDNCGGDVTVVSDAVFPITENTTVIWTYDDGNGNTVNQSQEIIFAPIDVTTAVTEAITIAANNGDATAYQWINCADGSEIPDATEQSYTPTANGDYAVIVFEDPCADTSECVTITQVGIYEHGSTELEIYPNPVTGEFLTMNSTESIEAIWLMDIHGRKIELKQPKADGKIDLSNIESGNYIITFLTVNEELIKRKIIIIK